MRTLVSIFLAALLLACPLLCKADGPGCCADEATSCPTGESDHPVPADSEAVSCICAGAIKDLNSSVGHFELAAKFQPLVSFLLPAYLPARLPLALLQGRDGEPPGSSASGSQRIHAYLNNYRC